MKRLNVKSATMMNLKNASFVDAGFVGVKMNQKLCLFVNFVNIIST